MNVEQYTEDHELHEFTDMFSIRKRRERKHMELKGVLCSASLILESRFSIFILKNSLP